MDIISLLYDLLAGPCLYITVPLCITGLLRKAMIIFSGRDAGLRFPAVQQGGCVVSAGSVQGDFPQPALTMRRRGMALAVTSTIFHAAIFAAPLTAAAHWILIDNAWNVMPPRISPLLTSACTMAAIAAGAILLLRRTFVRHVLAVSSWRDYAAMACVMIPFVTGFMARMIIGPYEIIMLVHCAGAHLLLVAIGWTRLGHMIFFAAGRIAAPLQRSRTAA